jgi:hypothetical protein
MHFILEFKKKKKKKQEGAVQIEAPGEPIFKS